VIEWSAARRGPAKRCKPRRRPQALPRAKAATSVEQDVADKDVLDKDINALNKAADVETEN
jgi:hypothetical protein